MALQLIYKEHEQSTYLKVDESNFLMRRLTVYEIYWVFTYIYDICKTEIIPKIHNMYILSIIKLCNFKIGCKKHRKTILENEYVWRHFVKMISSLSGKTKYPVIAGFLHILTQTYSYRYELLLFFFNV